jgi:hypothetical protein
MRLALASLLFAAAASAATTHTALSGQRFAGDVVVNAPPDKVWTALVEGGALAKLLGFEAKAPAQLAKVGDSAGVVLVDPGTLVVSLAKPGAELRLYFEPDNGTYICQDRIVLTADGKGTKVSYEARYTESGAQKPEDLKAQAKKIDDGLAALKAAVEAKPAKK